MLATPPVHSGLKKVLASGIAVYRFIKAIVERIKVTINHINMFLLVRQNQSVY